MSIKEQYFTISQAANYMDVTRQTISRWIAQGRFPAEKVGREVIIKQIDFYRYENQLIGEKLINNVVFYCRYLVKESYDFKDEDIIEFNGIVDIDNSIYQFIVTRTNGVKDKINVKLSIVIVPREKTYTIDVKMREIWYPEFENINANRMKKKQKK